MTGKVGCLLLVLAGCAAAQSMANWNLLGAGNWSNAANWDCVINGASSHCIPGAGFAITNVGGDITLDINTSVAHILGTAGSLTLSNKSLTATDPLGIQVINGAVNLSNSAVINGTLITNDLKVENSTINGSTQAFNANIANGALGSLLIANQLTAANSTFGSGSNLTLNQNSSISNSTISGGFGINTSLTVDNASIINATQTGIGTGSLTLQGGSTWNASFSPVTLGATPGGAAALDVTRTGSVMNLTTALELGELANSTVTVEHGGSIAATGANGNFLIGLGAVFTTDSKMLVNSGGSASATNITVEGSSIGSTGLLSISDSTSRVTANGQLLVAAGGEVIAANQSNLTVNSLRIQTGSVTIDTGATLNLTSGNAVLIGSAGTGSLTFQGGGTGTSSGQLVLGTSNTSSGAVTVTGLGSQWSGSNSVIVGSSGSGFVNVLNGGLFETGADGAGVAGSLGDQASGVGTVTVQGADWKAGGDLQIGNAGTGTLQLSQAGTVESEDGKIGVSAGSIGTVAVTDPGSKWTLSGNLTVGSGGRGALTISNGGQVSNGNAVIGELLGPAPSSASVTGLGSRWVNSGKLTVGQNGTGSLLISAGAVVTNVDSVLGDKAGSSGSVTVAGLGSSWQNSGILSIGGDGAAGLTVDAGTVTAGGAAIGSNFAPVQVTVTNHGALSVLGDVSIGGGGTTQLTIENGGKFESGTNATIGGAGGDTTVIVTDAGSAWTLNGAGSSLTIDDKGTLMVMDGGTVTSSSITVDTGGLLATQDGNIVGSVFNKGGTVTAGDATGTMSITGNYSQTSGTLLYEIDGLGPGQFDSLVVSGVANLTGGDIEIQFGNGFVPTDGETFDLFSALGGLTISNVAFDVIGLPSNLRFTETIGANGFDLSFASTGSSAPEPGGAVLFAVGLGILLARRRMLVRATPLLPDTPQTFDPSPAMWYSWKRFRGARR